MVHFDAVSTPTEVEFLVSFCDLTLFARFASEHSNKEVFDFLSDYYEFVGETVEDAGGKVVKFLGDAALLVFPAAQVSHGVRALKNLKEQGDRWMRDRNVPCRHIIKAHFGPVVCGPIGTRSEKRFDVFGLTVNTAAVMKSHGFAMTPQVFRKLEAETRKLFKKHTPPVRYIPVEESHQD